MIGPISLEAKQMGARSAGNPHAACDAEGAGNVARPRYWDTRRRKGEPTGETNFGLNRRASPRPYLRARGGETPHGGGGFVHPFPPARPYPPRQPRGITSDRRIAAWGALRANWNYVKVGTRWGLGFRRGLE